MNRSALLAAAVAFSILPARGDASVWNAVEQGHLTWSNATTNWVNGDLVITYQTGEGTLHLPGYARVWALAVGGGGSGANGKALSSKNGGTGGGGAGGFVETKTLMMLGGEGTDGDYKITVGRGGPSLGTGTDKGPGNSGGKSSIKSVATSAAVMDEAPGGGAGSIENTGGSGGSGGGGSERKIGTKAYSSSGGAPDNDGAYGNSGGKGECDYIGGGGGGAGGVGIDASQGATGGLGKVCAITGNEVVYAAGGGGGLVAASGSLAGGAGGSSGIGGRGGDGTVVAEAGKDGTGSGGGGGSVKGPGGKGGDGVVIIRISLVVDGPLEKPQYFETPYTGQKITAAVAIPNVLTVSGEFEATVVRETPYRYHEELAEGFKWTDGTSDPVDAEWKIVPGHVTIPLPAFTEVTYDEKNHVVVEPPPEPKFKFVAGSVTAATNVGEYSYTAELLDKVNWRWSDGSITNQTFSWRILPREIPFQTLPTGLVYAGTNVVAVTNNPNYTFADGSVTNATDAGTYEVIYELADPANNVWPDGSVTNQTYYWTIARLPVDRPPIPGDTEPGVFVYNGSEREIATNSIYWTRTRDYLATDRGDYTAVLKLNKNWYWKESGTEDFVIDWQILQAKNEITSLTLGDWKLGEPPKTPSITAKFGANDVIYSYGKSASGAEWSPDPPETNGVFYVKAFIPEEREFGNWSSAVRTKRFLVYKSFDELFTDYVDIDFKGYAGAAIDDARVLVKISPAIYPGFSYDRCPTGDDLAFMNQTPGQDESPLSFDVDTWNPDGESLIWVKLPRLDTREGYANTKIRMYWHLREGMEGPGSDAVGTWSDYMGVWHFSEKISAADAPTTPSHDATGNGYDAMPRRTTGGDLSTMISTPGQIGNARVNATTGHTSGGNNLVVSNFAGRALGTNFVFSGWVKFDGYGSNGKTPWIVARKASGEEGGWAMALNGDATRKKLDLYGSGTTPKTSDPIASQGLANGWVHMTWAVSGTNYWLYTRSPNLGSFSLEGTLASPVGAELEPLVFGSDLANGAPSVHGKFDEFRLRPWSVSAGGPTPSQIAALSNEVNATYGNVTNPTSFVTHGWVVKDGVKQNYWIVEPDLTKREWDVGDEPGTTNAYKVAIGTVNYTCTRQFDGEQVLTNALPVAAGRYVITFTVVEEGFNTLEKQVGFVIRGHSGYPSVGETEEGRILLANDDSQGDWSETSVTNQAYWLKPIDVVTNIIYHPVTHRPIGTQIITNYISATYWVHSGDSTYTLYRPYLLTNSVHTLETTNQVAALCGGMRLWHLNQVRIGSVCNSDLSEDWAHNYLSWSATSCAISSNGVAFSQKEIGNMVFRNTKEACLYSPCYTNGIGTIYFDAVNFRADAKPQNYCLCVEVATSVTNETGEVISDAQGRKLLPTDINVRDIGVRTNEDSTVVVYTNEDFYARAKWEPVRATRTEITGNTSVTLHEPSETIRLDMQAGGSHENFYRIHVPLNIREPARFRIRRISADPDADLDGGNLGNGLILLDNVIASKPTMRADMESYGWFDPGKTGPNVLGMECATTVPYPSITDTDIRGRARAIYTTSGEPGADTNGFVTGVDFHYRWRYLNQQPTDMRKWSEPIAMRRTGGQIVTESPLEHPVAEGDIEYWYETFLQAPFYSYTDYSGTGHRLNGTDGKPYYTEEILVVTNRFDATERYRKLGGKPLPSLGTDWFFRLRNGRDLHGSAALCVTKGPLRGNYPMHLAEDSTWRCLLPLPKDASGDCEFYFTICDEQTPGATEVATNRVYCHPTDELTAIPAKGTVTEGRIPMSFAIDHAATHLEWRLNDKLGTFAVTRAEYQDFNDWNDVHSPRGGGGEDFYASYTSTNGVNLVNMQSYPAPIATWKVYVATDTAWEETFYLPGYTGSDTNDFFQPRDTVFPSHTTPNDWWDGTYIAFVQEILGGTLVQGKGPDGKEYFPYPANSGMAGKLLGQGRGRLEYVRNSSKPDGLERITFKARIGQSIEEDGFAYSKESIYDMNYTFSALASMSHKIGDDNKEVDMAAGGAVSLIAYYVDGVGFYEFRVERIEQGTRALLSLWKWHIVNGRLKDECLVKRRMDGYKLWTDNSQAPAPGDGIGNANSSNPQYRQMFISVENGVTEDGSTPATRIYGGFSHAARLPFTSVTTESEFDQQGDTGTGSAAVYGGYGGIYYEDTAFDRGQYGAYGVIAKDCPAEFLRLKRGGAIRPKDDKAKEGIDLRPKDTADYAFMLGRTDPHARWFRREDTKSRWLGLKNSDLTDIGGDLDTGNPIIRTKWKLPPNRIECFTNEWAKAKMPPGEGPRCFRGLRMPNGLEQKLVVQLAPVEHPNQWETVATNTVAGYGFTGCAIPLYLKGQYNMRLTTGSEAIDVVVDDVKQTRWMGEDVTDVGGSGSDEKVFYCTQSHVVTNTTANRMEVELVPSRAHADKALSIRSPVIDGLGKISFDYAGAQPSTEIWVQMATNAVASSLTGANGYNNSIRSVDYGRQQQVGEWITLAKYSTAADSSSELHLDESGTKTVYVGLHDQKDQGRPIKGAFRLFIPATKVEDTDRVNPDGTWAEDRDYGRISITGLTVWDEPGLDARSWRGWNLRTIGDEKDGEKRMYLCDMSLVSREGEAKSGHGLVGALNNSINDVPGEDPEKIRTGYPAIWSPTLGTYVGAEGKVTQASVGEVTFKARMYDTNPNPTYKAAVVSIWGASSSIAESNRWTCVTNITVSQQYLQNYTWKAGGEEYAAIRFEVTDPSAKTKHAVYDRVILDEITITERVAPTLSFVYAWPFRTGLDNDLPITDYASREQQPLAGENWGVQTQLRLQQLGDDVDLDRGLEIYLAYFDGAPTESNWGYENWKDAKTGEVRLVQVGDPSNLVFRSVSAAPETVMAPLPDPNTVVQFMLRVKYYDKGGYAYWDQLRSWTPPSWYHPVDYNASLGAKSGGFAAYTILDRISPGRAWINEVQWNNGSRTVTHTDDKVTDNQFVEVCIPSGMDMSGWKVRAYDQNGDSYDIATFGTLRVASSKTSGRSVSGYEFFVLMSPETQKAGKLRDAWGGLVDPDGTWSMTSDLAGLDGGTFGYAQPYAFELIRPSGVIEHTFTIDGTNEWGSVRYDATNLLVVLNEADHSPSRFYAGREEEKNVNGGTYAPRGTTYGSSGVTGERGSGVLAASGPGSEGTWTHGLDFTVGSLNPGQVIPADWLLAPNGTNTWVYFTVVGDHISQRIGKGTNRTELVILPQGAITNVLYTADPWWEVLSIAVDGVTNVVNLRGKDRPYPFSVPEGSGSRVNVVATEGVDSRLDDDKFKLKGQRYRNAVLKWLGQEKWKDKTPDDIRFARMAQLNTPVATHAMTLIDMYWLDICPFNSEGSTFEPTPEMDPLSSEWVLRAGFTDYAPNAVARMRSGEEILNSVFKVKMFITNEFTHAVYAPYTLQGIGNERSCDGNWSGNSWTSETFKINGKLNVNLDSGFNKGFLPFREFVFYPGSFAPATAGEGTRTEGGVPGTPGAFEAVIELIDPFSGLSTPGVSYGWWRWPRSTSAFFNWRITHTNASPMSVEYLMPQSTYDR